jgi:thymidylate synthase
MDQVKQILERDPEKYELPKLKINDSALGYLSWKDCNLQILNPNDFELENYQSYPAIKAKLSTGLK